MEVWVAGIGVLGPGLEGWASASTVLKGEKPYAPSPVQLDPPEILNARERRRASPPVRLALNAAREAVSQSGIPENECASAFGSSCGDGVTLHHLLEALADPEGLVSPTQFHNSVHNAAIGYWSIGTGARLAATSIAAQDQTFGATFLKACMQATLEKLPVLLAVFDMPFPEPLHSVHPLSGPFSVALVLTAEKSRSSVAAISVDWSADGSLAETEPGNSSLRTLWRGNPAARSVPLLETLASGDKADVVIRYPVDGSLMLTVVSC